LYFWTWNTQEVLDLVLWMREYNRRAGAPRLRFFGFDMQSPHQSIDSVTAILGRLDAGLSAAAREAGLCFSGVRDAQGNLLITAYAQLSLAFQARCASAYTSLATEVATRRATWSSRLSADDLDWLERYIELVRQWERMARFGSAVDARYERDRSMAENALWVARREPAARHFIWAHNNHISRTPRAMGHHLSRALGTDYRAVAFTFGTGSFNAVTINANGSFGALQRQSISATTAGTLEAYFAAHAQERFILDMRKVTGTPAGSIAIDRRLVTMRSIGAAYGSTGLFFIGALFPADFDAIIWFSQTEASRLLP
jgi:erythromycin esterase